MAQHVIDGTIEAIAQKRTALGRPLFESARFRMGDGSVRTVGKFVATHEVATALRPGASGRFYFFKVLDQSGVHAVRTLDGHAISGFPKTIETLFAVMGLLNALVVGAGLALDGGLRMLALLIAAACIAVTFIARQARAAAERQFQADAPGARIGTAPAQA